MNDCLFCKIAQKIIPANIIFENDDIMAFHDIRPQAPIHALIIPKKHITTINDCTKEDVNLLGNVILTAKKIATDLKIHETGYRLVYNVNSHGGQEVYHIHLHLLGSRQMHWPPG